jgi:hypothetical protein
VLRREQSSFVLGRRYGGSNCLTAFVFRISGRRKEAELVTNAAAIQTNPMLNVAAAAPQSGELIAGRKSRPSPRGTRKIRCPARRQIACAAVIERREFD